METLNLLQAFEFIEGKAGSEGFIRALIPKFEIKVNRKNIKTLTQKLSVTEYKEIISSLVKLLKNKYPKKYEELGKYINNKYPDANIAYNFTNIEYIINYSNIAVLHELFYNLLSIIQIKTDSKSHLDKDNKKLTIKNILKLNTCITSIEDFVRHFGYHIDISSDKDIKKIIKLSDGEVYTTISEIIEYILNYEKKNVFVKKLVKQLNLPVCYKCIDRVFEKHQDDEDLDEYSLLYFLDDFVKINKELRIKIVRYILSELKKASMKA